MKKKIMKTIGNELKQVRVVKNYTLAYVAKKCKISTSKLCKIENNQATLSFETFIQLALFYEISPGSLVNMVEYSICKEPIQHV
jgi:transcriptional regulator with XRE-family HTH domain